MLGKVAAKYTEPSHPGLPAGSFSRHRQRLRGLGMMKAAEVFHHTPLPAPLSCRACLPTGSSRVRQSGLCKGIQESRAEGSFQRCCNPVGGGGSSERRLF